MKKNKRILYLDLIKIISTLLVIFNHSHSNLNGSSMIFKIIYVLCFDVCKIAVPLFIMVTGALILNNKSTYDIILKKRIPRIYIAVLISTIIGAFYYKKNLLFIISSVWSGQTNILYFLWYGYILIYLYLLIPFIAKMIKKFNKKDYKIFIIISVIIPSIILFIPYFFDAVFSIKIHITSRLISSSFLVNIGLLVIGNYINKKDISKKENKVASFIAIITIIIGFIYVYYGYSKNNSMVDFYYNTFPPTILAICLFIKFKHHYKNKESNKFIAILSNSSFGVYLTHVYLLEYLTNLKIFNTFLNKYNLIAYVFLIIFTYTSLTFLFYLIKKIKFFKNVF